MFDVQEVRERLVSVDGYNDEVIDLIAKGKLASYHPGPGSRVDEPDVIAKQNAWRKKRNERMMRR